ncbi:HAMP domain-containing sensor histidine kinase [Streptomyces sp. NBC_00083]|uniref:sensor histidine kinase n=1 Tax=Streptomyces sp. NBC_00083 TaxID=2975647 RepID=UPI0022548674|nr:HAMP domain-containing sensor histidine kinase [Streptomyces sp. NBC_00083]MCX5385705.1 HAMP domain-containing histidine kinase [Streptomyces sp. NBC_00083]
MKLATRIALAVGVTVPLLVLASGWLLLALVGRDLHRAEDSHLRSRATAIAQDARTLLRAAANDRPTAEENRQRRLFNAALDVGVRLVGPDGTFSGGPQPDPSVALPAATRAPVTVRGGGRSWRAYALPVTGAQVSGTLWVFEPDTASRAQITLVRHRVTTTALLAAPLSALLAWAVASAATRPLGRLRRAAAGLDPRTTSARLEHRRTRVVEVDDLAATLRTVLARYDEQAARTAEALDTARSFSAAASHELRNPLMSMGTNLDVLAHPGLPGAERAEVVEDLRREHGRLLGMLVALRELGRGDLVEADAFRVLDVAEVADAAVAEARRRAPDAHITLSAEPAPLHGWEPGIRILLDNLLGNALAHGRDAEGRALIAVAVAAAGGEVLITVDDRGPGVAPGARRDVFRRFHRGPASSGSGLGLTLVAQQAALHRGSVELGEGPGGTGTRCTVRLPVGATVREGELPARRDWLTVTAERSQGSHKEPS